MSDFAWLEQHCHGIVLLTGENNTEKTETLMALATKAGADMFSPLTYFHGTSQKCGAGASCLVNLLSILIGHKNPTTFAMQQPETFLDQHVQAALGTFFVRKFKDSGHQFMIETHSDQLVKGIRLEIAKGNISPEDVKLLWFEKTDDGSRIHTITLDANGNVVDAPDGYAAFLERI